MKIQERAFNDGRTIQPQAGIILPVALIVLLLVSIIVASTVQTSRFEERMALNVQIGNQTFQAAETALDDLLNDTSVLDAVILGDESAAESSVTLDTGGSTQLQRLRAERDATYIGQTICIGFSLDKCKNHKVEMVGRAYVDEDGVYGNDDDEARTVLIQGLDRYNYVTED